MKKIISALGAISLGLSSVKADEVKHKTDVEVSSIAISSDKKIGIKSSIDVTADKVNFYLTHGDDPRIGAEDFTSGGISWTDENLTLGAR